MFRIRDTSTGLIVPGFPSPFLIGLAGTVEAYPTSDSANPFWRARDDAYDAVNAPGVVYTNVRIEHTEDWRVDLSITATESGGQMVAQYDDYFIVQAATRGEAEDLASAKAREDVADREDNDNLSVDIRILRAREGVSI